MQIDQSIRDALDEVREAGEQDGNEHVICLREGKRIFRLDGDERHVCMSKEIDSGMIKRGDTIVHNHPASLNSLSNNDLYLANQLRVNALVVSEDGSIYRSDFSQPRVPNVVLELLWDIAATELANHHEVFFDESVVRPNSAHWVNRMLSHGKLINYEFELQPETKALVDKLDAELKFQYLERYLEVRRYYFEHLSAEIVRRFLQ